jgi:hypothetical protein
MLMFDFNTLKGLGGIGLEETRPSDFSSNANTLFEAYSSTLRGMLAEREWETPFDSQDSIQIKGFFKDMDSRWSDRKAELGLIE